MGDTLFATIISTTIVISSQSSDHLSDTKISSLGEEEASGEDIDLENPVVSNWVETPYLQPIKIPPRTQAPLSPCPLISTTTSELELEQGEALLRVKRVRAKEESPNDPFPNPEVESSDGSEKPAPKKRKTCSKGTKSQSRKVRKSGTKIYPHEVSTWENLSAGKVAMHVDQEQGGGSKSRGRKKNKPGTKTHLAWMIPMWTTQQNKWISTLTKTLQKRKISSSWSAWCQSKASTGQ